MHNVSQHLRVLKERRLVASRKEAQTVYYRVTNLKFIQGCALIRQALIEQHRAQGQSLLAAELLDGRPATCRCPCRSSEAGVLPARSRQGSSEPGTNLGTTTRSGCARPACKQNTSTNRVGEGEA